MNPIRQFYDAVWNSAAAVQRIVERQSAGGEGEIDGVPFRDERTDRRSELAALNAAFVGDLPALFAAAMRSESDQTARQAIEAVRAAYVEFREAAGRLDPRLSNTRWQAATDAMFAAMGALHPFAMSGPMNLQERIRRKADELNLTVYYSEACDALGTSNDVELAAIVAERTPFTADGFLSADSTQRLDMLHLAMTSERAGGDRPAPLAVVIPPQPVDDDSAYVEAAILRAQRPEFTRADQLTRYLSRVNKTATVIRTLKPSRNRLLVHAGDWHVHFDQQGKDILDGDAESVDALVADIETRKSAERNRRKG